MHAYTYATSKLYPYLAKEGVFIQMDMELPLNRKALFAFPNKDEGRTREEVGYGTGSVEPFMETLSSWRKMKITTSSTPVVMNIGVKHQCRGQAPVSRSGTRSAGLVLRDSPIQSRERNAWRSVRLPQSNL